MELRKVKNYIEQIDYLIGHECTGTADEFARKLGVSERTLQYHLQQLREIGVDIAYNHYKRTYYYIEKGSLTFGFTAEAMSLIKGGKVLSGFHCFELID